jgi:hypothetical protein
VKAFEPAEWPPSLDAVKDRYGRSFSDPARWTPDIRPFSWTMLFRVPLLIHPVVTLDPSPESPRGRLVGYLILELVANRGETLTRERLLQDVWGYTSTPFTRTVDVHVAWLRQKLEIDSKQPQWIVTVHGLGYRFAG